MLSFLSRRLTRRNRVLLKQGYHRAMKFVADAFLPYTSEDLRYALGAIGVREGDTVFLHSSFSVQNGFQGSPHDIISCLLGVLGPAGNLLMPSMSYSTSSYEYLMKQEVFHAARTPSRMGLLSELFRRRQDVLRSLNPAHPVLALGPDAEALVAGHDRVAFSCGPDTPFDRFDRMGGKVVFFDVPFNTFTFIHHLEHRLRTRLPFALYRPEPLTARAVDHTGTERTIPTYVFSNEAVSARRPLVLQKKLEERGALKRACLGRSRLMLVTARDARECAEDMAKQGQFFYQGEPHGV